MLYTKEMETYANDTEDKSNMYELSELQQSDILKYQGDIGKSYEKTTAKSENENHVYTIPNYKESGYVQFSTQLGWKANAKSKKGVRTLLIVLILILVVVLVLEVVMLVHLYFLPVLCRTVEDQRTNTTCAASSELLFNDKLFSQNNTKLLKQIAEDTGASAQKLTSIDNELSNLVTKGIISNITNQNVLMLAQISQLIDYTKNISLFMEEYRTYTQANIELLEQVLTVLQNNSELLEELTIKDALDSTQNLSSINTKLDNIEKADTMALESIKNITNQSSLILSQVIQLVDSNQNILLLVDEHRMDTHNNTEILQQLLVVLHQSTQTLNSTVSSLSSLATTDTTTQGAINDVLIAVKELLELQNGSLIFSSHLPISCQDIKKKQPNSPSGYYNLNNKLIYCHMGELCNNTGGWTRLGHLDMSDSTVNCPAEFQLFEEGGVRACGRPNHGIAGCMSVKLPSNGISYSQVCGRVIGYQYASLDIDAVDLTYRNSSMTHNDIDAYYVNGISITRGFPRKHIWTLMAGTRDSSSSSGNCPCNTPSGSTQYVQSFIGSDYFCESGNPSNTTNFDLYTDNPLWDGKGCGSQEENCCSASGLPWFHKTTNSTTDYIELRNCCDGDSVNNDTSHEDVGISFYEIYVK